MFAVQTCVVHATCFMPKPNIMSKLPFTINAGGRLLSLERPVVMGIVNVTPDSFYGCSRVGDDELLSRCRAMIEQGAAIIDVGACSTRPSGDFVSCDEELERLHRAFELLDKAFPDAIFSVDTFRARVARECVAHHNVAIINDVSGYDWDKDMFDAVCQLNVPYILTHTKGVAGDEPEYANFIPEVVEQLARKLWALRQAGVNDVIVDAGFGFGKSLEQNYALMAALGQFSLLEAPMLVGISRKSMITKVLSVAPADALNGTTVLNTIALMQGANILRVHDVTAAVEAVAIVEKLRECTPVF